MFVWHGTHNYFFKIYENLSYMYLIYRNFLQADQLTEEQIAGK